MKTFFSAAAAMTMGLCLSNLYAQQLPREINPFLKDFAKTGMSETIAPVLFLDHKAFDLNFTTHMLAASPIFSAVQSSHPIVVAKPTRITVVSAPINSPGAISAYTVGGKQVLQSAGTFGDLPRYLQTLPGVTANSDIDNSAIVRGGNPFEDLYILDGLEVPNINHLALADSSGGLISMIDTSLIASADFYTGTYDSTYESHLSSVLNMHTAELGDQSKNEVDLGFAGAGGSMVRPVGPDGMMMFAFRQSFINLLTPDIGLNGSPVYTNSLAKFVREPSSSDRFWVVSLSGLDSLKMRPDALDNWETNAYDTDYSGWRNTTGLVWQRTYESEAVGTWTLSNSEQSQKLSQYDQVQADALLFRQNNDDGVTELKYDYLTKIGENSHANAGFDFHLNRINYDVSQPNGLLTPYSASTTPVAAYTLTPHFSTIDRAAYLDLAIYASKRLTVLAGVRGEEWGYQGTTSATSTTTTSSAVTSPVSQQSSSTTTTCCCDGAGLVMPLKWNLMPHASMSFRVAPRFVVKAGFSQSSQLPPYGVIAGAPGNSSLWMIDSTHFVAGADIAATNNLVFSVEAYRKSYSNYPVSTDYPSLSLADTIPTLGQAFSNLSMTSSGKGVAQGIEFTARLNTIHHIFGQANAAFARSDFSGTDGVLRPSNYDFPIVLNLTGGVNIKNYIVTVRNTFTSGRPYTPLDASNSYVQNRLIYDLSQLNALRGPVYNRLDVALNKSFHVAKKTLDAHVGALNALNRQNFYDYAWRPRCPSCGAIEQPQIGFMPDIGLSLLF